MPRPFAPPIGLVLAGAAKAVGRAFDDAMAEAGGSRAVWLVLLALKTGRAASQRELAAAIGIEGATLTHHLTAMEADGLVERRRDPDNRRVQVVSLTAQGEDLFVRLRGAAQAFDRRLRSGIGEAELATLRSVLARLQHNATGSEAFGAG